MFLDSELIKTCDLFVYTFWSLELSIFPSSRPSDRVQERKINVTFHRKTRLTENSVLGAFETANKRGLTAFQTLHKLFSNALQTIRKLLTNAWKAFQTLFKPFANGFQTVWKAFQTLLKPFANASQTLCKCFANPLQTFRKPFANALQTLCKRFSWKPAPVRKELNALTAMISFEYLTVSNGLFF